MEYWRAIEASRDAESWAARAEESAAVADAVRRLALSAAESMAADLADAAALAASADCEEARLAAPRG
jgi:hypothetical protein